MYMYNANIMSELPFGRKTLHFCNLQHCKTSLQHYKVIPHYHASSITKKIEKYINIHKIKNEEHICVTNKNFKISSSCSPVFPSSSVLEPPLERRNLVMIQFFFKLAIKYSIGKFLNLAKKKKR